MSAVIFYARLIFILWLLRSVVVLLRYFFFCAKCFAALKAHFSIASAGNVIKIFNLVLTLVLSIRKSLRS